MNIPNLRIAAAAAARAMLVLAVLVALGACSRVPLPKLPEIRSKPEPVVDVTATPRDLLTARLVNPRTRDDMPNMTVGKMIEFADRYLACDCAKTRFVRAWEKTSGGYRLLTNSDAVRPIEFVCQDSDDGKDCFLTEIDRGQRSDSLAERFVPGADFIRFLYENGVRCERVEPCP